MTEWFFQHGDILDIEADVLVCSANVYLNLSGGVGGALLMRYGPAMQDELHKHLADRGIRHVARGDVVETSPCGAPYRLVLHAVAVDGFYETSSDIVRAAMQKSLALASEFVVSRERWEQGPGRFRVAMTALGAGYGRLTMADIAAAVRPLLSDDYAMVDEVVLCVRHVEDWEELLRLATCEKLGGERLTHEQIFTALNSGCSEEQFLSMACPVCGSQLKIVVHEQKNVYHVTCAASTIHLGRHGCARTRPTWWNKFARNVWY